MEFLGLNERALVTENDLEQSILDNLQRFLLEMGHGFCFEARQKRILIDEDYFFGLTFSGRRPECDHLRAPGFYSNLPCKRHNAEWRKDSSGRGI